MKTQLIGYYNRHGYRIEDNLDGEILYEAGNNPLESTSHVDPADGLNLKTIRSYCDRTGKAMSREHVADYIGTYREEPETC